MKEPKIDRETSRVERDGNGYLLEGHWSEPLSGWCDPDEIAEPETDEDEDFAPGPKGPDGYADWEFVEAETDEDVLIVHIPTGVAFLGSDFPAHDYHDGSVDVDLEDDDE